MANLSRLQHATFTCSSLIKKWLVAIILHKHPQTSGYLPGYELEITDADCGYTTVGPLITTPLISTTAIVPTFVSSLSFTLLTQKDRIWLGITWR